MLPRLMSTCRHFRPSQSCAVFALTRDVHAIAKTIGRSASQAGQPFAAFDILKKQMDLRIKKKLEQLCREFGIMRRGWMYGGPQRTGIVFLGSEPGNRGTEARPVEDAATPRSHLDGKRPFPQPDESPRIPDGRHDRAGWTDPGRRASARRPGPT